MNERSIFMEALEFDDPREREAHLQRACGSDDQMRARVEALLHRHQKAEVFILDQEAWLDLTSTADLAGPSEQPGTWIGSYRLIEVIGEGGMGVVYLAEQTKPVKRMVALKVIKPGLDSRQLIARFEAERQALALMDHPNIAKVLDAGATAAGRPFLVMELIKGVPITRYCDEHRLTPRERLELFLRVCQAVQHAHQKGIIHRDIKPSNVFVGLYDGRPVPKIIDFGVAKAAGPKLTEATLITGFGAVIGTPEYMSPEQAQLDNLDIDTRSDLYSLGVLMYELLTGSTPFTRKDLEKAGLLEMMRVIREQEPTKPSAKLSTAKGLPTLAANRSMEPTRLKKQLRGDLDWIVMKCLEKNRSRRYETATGLADDVQHYLNNEPVSASPPSALYHLRRFARRNMVTLTAGMLVVVALLSGTAVSVWQAVRATHASQRSQLMAAELALDKGQRLGESGDPGAALLWLSRSLSVASFGSNKLQMAIRTSLSAWGRQAHVLRWTLPPDAPMTAVTFAPDDTLVTAGYAGGKVIVRRWNTGTGQPCQPLVLVRDSRELQLVASPEFGSQQRAQELAARTEKPHDVPMQLAIAFSPKADSLLLGTLKRTVRLFDLTTGKLLWETSPEKDGHAVSAAFSPDGGKVLVGYALGRFAARPYTGKARLFAAATGKPLGPAMVHRRPVHAGAFHPDGQSLATACGLFVDSTEAMETRFWDLTGREIRGPLEYVGMASAMAYSPDGARLVVGLWDRKALLWELAPEREPIVLPHEGPVRSMAFSPDGNVLMTGSLDASIRFWDGGGRLLGAPLRQGHFVDHATLSPDGRNLAVGIRGHGTRLWHLAVDGLSGPGDAYDLATFPLAVSPDGRTVLVRGEENSVILRDAATRQPVSRPLPHRSPVLVGGIAGWPGWRYACSSDRRRVLTLEEDKLVRLWDAQTGELVAERRADLEPDLTFFTAAFSPDSRILVTGQQSSGANLWDATTGEHIRTIRTLNGPGGHQVSRMILSAQGTLLLTAELSGAVHFWDPGRGTELGAPLMQHAPIFALAISPDGRTIVTGGVDGNVLLWDVETRHRLLRLSGHHGAINDAAFSPDGRFVVTGGGDGSARLWDVASGMPIGPPLPHQGPVVRVQFGCDGRTILTATQDQAARSWPVPTAITGTPELVELRAQVATGMELDDDGNVQILDSFTWQKRSGMRDPQSAPR